MTEMVRVANTQKPGRTADIVFLHGLDGDARLTWGAALQGEGYNLDLFWPLWLGEDFPDAGIWSVQYDAAGSKWKGSSMPIGDRATNVLELVDVSGLGALPLIFITHSMGGLVVKQMLQDLRTGTNVKPHWQPILAHTRGIAFFSTPHNGSLPASLLRSLWPLRPGLNVAELAANNPHLRKLNQWFRANIDPSKIHLLVYCEAQSVRGLRVVDEGSADPGMTGVTAVPVDFDHVRICKLASKDMRYHGVAAFIRRALDPPAGAPPVRSGLSLLAAAETVVERFRELDGKIAVSVSSVLRFHEDWTKDERKDLVAQLQALAYSEVALSKARTALHHLGAELQARYSIDPTPQWSRANEILNSCRAYLYALCPNDRATPFPSTAALQKFLNDIVEADNPDAVQAVMAVAKTVLGLPARDCLDSAELSLGALRGIASH